HKNLMDLLSSPIKVKNDRDLYRKLYAYFKSFPEPVEFSIYHFDQKNFDLVEGAALENRAVFNKIKQTSLPKIFIGKTLDVDAGRDRIYCAFPVYKKENKESWCVCVIERKRKEYVLNDLFFRHLENTVIYRKNLEKMSGYLDLANKDDVTGLFNQRKLVSDLAKTIEYHGEIGKTFSVMFLDVDHFKLVNDNFGHVVGSQMLVEIAQELRNVLRSTDKIYRYGGDEFVVIMPEIKMEITHKIAMRVRASLKEKKFNINTAKDYQLSLSIGIAEYPTDAKTANEIIDFADSMMYASKKSGRGKIFHIGEVQNDLADS
ncbi:MAG: GGDEF domain-containing protein, partial [Bacteriovoracaceae bacterium]